MQINSFEDSIPYKKSFGIRIETSTGQQIFNKRGEQFPTTLQRKEYY